MGDKSRRISTYVLLSNVLPFFCSAVNLHSAHAQCEFISCEADVT